MAHDDGDYYKGWLERQHDHLIQEIRKKEQIIGEQIAELVNKTLLIEKNSATIKSQGEFIDSLNQKIEGLQQEIFEIEQDREMRENQ